MLRRYLEAYEPGKLAAIEQVYPLLSKDERELLTELRELRGTRELKPDAKLRELIESWAAKEKPPERS